jgi:hypothetical protein
MFFSTYGRLPDSPMPKGGMMLRARGLCFSHHLAPEASFTVIQKNACVVQVSV